MPLRNTGEEGGGVRNRATPEGRQLGERLAKWADDAEPAARLRLPDLPPRCNSCAFRAGAHTANGSPSTQMDALKCVMEGVQFNCHEPHREDSPCSGWAMLMLAKDGPDFVTAPWPFSDEAPNV